MITYKHMPVVLFCLTCGIESVPRHGRQVKWYETSPGALCQANDWRLFNGMCYKYFSDKSTFEEARAVCTNQSSQLATANSQEINNAFVDLNQNVSSIRKREMWLNARVDPGDHNVWSWGDSNDTMNFTNWRMGEPDDFSGSDDCMTMSASLGYPKNWQDRRCDSDYTFICQAPQREPTSEPTRESTTGVHDVSSRCKRKVDSRKVVSAHSQWLGVVAVTLGVAAVTGVTVLSLVFSSVGSNQIRTPRGNNLKVKFQLHREKTTDTSRLYDVMIAALTAAVTPAQTSDLSSVKGSETSGQSRKTGITQSSKSLGSARTGISGATDVSGKTAKTGVSKATDISGKTARTGVSGTSGKSSMSFHSL